MGRTTLLGKRIGWLSLWIVFFKRDDDRIPVVEVEVDGKIYPLYKGTLIVITRKTKLLYEINIRYCKSQFLNLLARSHKLKY